MSTRSLFAIATLFVVGACADATGPTPTPSLTPVASASIVPAPATSVWVEWPLYWVSNCGAQPNWFVGNMKAHIQSRITSDGLGSSYYREHVNGVTVDKLVDSEGRKYNLVLVGGGEQNVEPLLGSAQYEYKYRLIPMGDGPRVMEVLIVRIQISWTPTTWESTPSTAVECH